MRAFTHAGWHVTFASAAEPGERAEGLDRVTDDTAAILLNDESFDRFVAEQCPDVVIFDRFMIEEQFGWRVEKQCPDALRVLDTVDLHCLRRTREHTPAAPIDALLASDDAKREIAAILRSDLSLIISRCECELLVDEFSVVPALLHYLPFMIEPNAIAVPTPTFAERRHFVTIGNFLHSPNLDSVRWLHTEIWPLLRARLPDVELHVYGAYTPASILALDDAATGFRVRGWAPDALAALASSRVCVAPLRFGAGLKGKLVDAMLAGTPCVTTPIGAEGMGEDGRSPVDTDWCGRIATTADAFTEACVELHETQSLWDRARHRGTEIVRSAFDAERLAAELLARIDDCIAHRESRRIYNFTGSMLRHHSHRATEYMARWIETKNRNN